MGLSGEARARPPEHDHCRLSVPRELCLGEFHFLKDDGFGTAIYEDEPSIIEIPIPFQIDKNIVTPPIRNGILSFRIREASQFAISPRLGIAAQWFGHIHFMADTAA